MAEKQKVCIIGDGGWGTTLAVLLSMKGCAVTLWGVFPEYIDVLKDKRENVKFLPGVSIPNGVNFVPSLEEALRGKELVVLAVPSQYMRGVLTMMKMENLAGKRFINVAKGVENKTLKCMSGVICDVLGDQKFAVLSGPTIALEVANGTPTTVVVGAKDLTFAKEVQDIFMTEHFRVYTTDDVIGVEIGGALKNIIAIAAGMIDALGFGTNAKAALLTRGLAEITRLGVAMGARRETFYGLSGLGDMTTTCISQYSRNRWLGEELGRGKRLDRIIKETEMVVEGVATTRSAYDLSKKHKVEMPITSEIYRVIYESKDPKKALHDLMTRSPKTEEQNYQ